MTSCGWQHGCSEQTSDPWGSAGWSAWARIEDFELRDGWPTVPPNTDTRYLCPGHSALAEAPNWTTGPQGVRSAPARAWREHRAPTKKGSAQ